MGRITRRHVGLAAAGTLAGLLTWGQAEAAVAGGRRRAVPRSGVSRGGPGHTEMRGMWIATVSNVDWPSAPGRSAADAKAELTALFDVAARWRLNTVILQVRPTADALWPSRFEPWSQWLTGTQGRDPGWDPLAFAVREAHARGLRLHAWFNPYRVSLRDDPALLAPGHPARRHPEWVVPYGGKLYYNPGIPEVRAFVQSAMADAVARYEIDGVHWDDYFYPYPVAGEEFDDAAAFAEYGGDFASRAAWRRHNVDLLVREMAARVRRERPGIPFGISPFAVWRNQATDPLGSRTQAGVQTYDDLYADTRKWVGEGWIDYIVPQIYWNIGFEAADYAELVRWWSQVARGTGVAVYVGEAVYKVGDPAQPAAWQDPAELSRHLTLCADHPEIRGNVYYSATQVAADPLGAMSRVYQDHYRPRA